MQNFKIVVVEVCGLRVGCWVDKCCSLTQIEFNFVRTHNLLVCYKYGLDIGNKLTSGIIGWNKHLAIWMLGRCRFAWTRFCCTRCFSYCIAAFGYVIYMFRGEVVQFCLLVNELCTIGYGYCDANGLIIGMFVDERLMKVVACCNFTSLRLLYVYLIYRFCVCIILAFILSTCNSTVVVICVGVITFVGAVALQFACLLDCECSLLRSCCFRYGVLGLLYISFGIAVIEEVCYMWVLQFCGLCLIVVCKCVGVYIVGIGLTENAQLDLRHIPIDFVPILSLVMLLAAVGVEALLRADIVRSWDGKQCVYGTTYIRALTRLDADLRHIDGCDVCRLRVLCLVVYYKCCMIRLKTWCVMGGCMTDRRSCGFAGSKFLLALSCVRKGKVSCIRFCLWGNSCVRLVQKFGFIRFIVACQRLNVLCVGPISAASVDCNVVLLSGIMFLKGVLLFALLSNFWRVSDLLLCIIIRFSYSLLMMTLILRFWLMMVKIVFWESLLDSLDFDVNFGTVWFVSTCFWLLNLNVSLIALRLLVKCYYVLRCVGFVMCYARMVQTIYGFGSLLLHLRLTT
eukprot:gene2941-1923_t